MKILIGIVIMVALAAVVTAVIVGNKSFEGIVVDKPYERGLSWDREQKERTESGLNIEIKNKTFTVGENDLLIQVTDREQKPVPDAILMLTVSRPSSSAYDRTYRFSGGEGGVYSAPVALPLYGHWDLRITIVRNGQNLLFPQKIFVEQ
ncbi:MAG TPA: FixH family protein [Thermodesulfovibrionales bacterium]|nr:FixH family protein [Thermodesulfovibrionales bacterium]